MRREDRSSISSHPLADLGGYQLLGLLHRSHLVLRSSFVRAGRPFLRPGLSRCQAPRTRAVKVGRCAWLASRAGAARPRLDGPEHGATLQADWGAVASLLTHSKLRSLWRTAQAMRASLLASAIASTL